MIGVVSQPVAPVGALSQPVAPVGVIGGIATDGYYAASFDGTTGHIMLPGIPLTDAGAFTIEAWIKKTASTSQRSFFSNRGGSGHIYAGISGAHPFMFINGATPASFNGANALVAGTVYHIAFTSDGATSRAYVNGVLNASLAQTLPTTDPSNGAGIGYDPALPTEVWDGSIDNVRVYRRCLAAAEIAARAAGSEVDMTALAGWWRLNEGSGTVALDSSGNNKAGTLNGPTYGPGIDLDSVSRPAGTITAPTVPVGALTQPASPLGVLTQP